jgi:hypothetical protein
LAKPVIGLCRRGNQGSGDIIFTGSIENILFDNVALECLPKYHRFGFLSDICVSVRVRKPFIGLCSRGNQGSGDIIFMGSIENISCDNVALERLPKYHRLGFLADICGSMRARKTIYRVVQPRQSGFRGYYFHGAIENISCDNVALERLPKYHRLGFLADICGSMRARKTSYRVVQARQSGFRGYYFHGAIENIRFDDVALERLPKYHRLGFLADICVSVHAQKPVIGLCRRGNQSSGDFIFMGL